MVALSFRSLATANLSKGSAANASVRVSVEKKFRFWSMKFLQNVFHSTAAACAHDYESRDVEDAMQAVFPYPKGAATLGLPRERGRDMCFF